MRFSEQKKDVHSITFYILLCFVLFSVFVIVPAVMIFYSKNLSGYYSADMFIYVFYYCLIVFAVLAFFLFLYYHFIKDNSISKLESKISEDLQHDLDDRIKNHLSKQALLEIILTELDQKITESTRLKVDDYIEVKKDETIKAITSIIDQFNNDLNKTDTVH